ncbi:hypothetical protein PG990_000607 [Apiospora arundinis]|uniref:DNase1 protein n=1 Tax=Apiospora arundinis TaxID=335852 RepID=A0ABR2HZV7_9PEZI
MQFTAKLAALVAAAASLASATNTITFKNQDSTPKTVIFTANAGFAPVNTVKVEDKGETTVTIPDGWQGNYFSIAEGSPINPGMLGEVAFQGWNDLTYFDVSAIVDATDVDGVKEIYPASQANAKVRVAFSGCKTFPCNTAYYHPDDIQTVSTKETHLITTLGGGSAVPSKRDEPALVPRKFVLGKF